MSNGTLPTAVLMKVERGEHATSGKYLQFFQAVKKPRLKPSKPL
jgi:hypothetical protein